MLSVFLLFTVIQRTNTANTSATPILPVKKKKTIQCYLNTFLEENPCKVEFKFKVINPI